MDAARVMSSYEELVQLQSILLIQYNIIGNILPSNQAYTQIIRPAVLLNSFRELVERVRVFR